MIIAADPHAGLGTPVDNGHCMRLVQVHHGVPHSSQLRRGERVREMREPPRGLIIATFNNAGRYANATDGSSHICVLLAKQPEGLRVVDQWVGKPVGERLIRYKGFVGKPVEDGDAYYAVETDDS